MCLKYLYPTISQHWVIGLTVTIFSRGELPPKKSQYCPFKYYSSHFLMRLLTAKFYVHYCTELNLNWMCPICSNKSPCFLDINRTLPDWFACVYVWPKSPVSCTTTYDDVCICFYCVKRQGKHKWRKVVRQHWKKLNWETFGVFLMCYWFLASIAGWFLVGA